MQVSIQVYSTSMISTGEAHKFNRKLVTLWHFLYNKLQKKESQVIKQTSALINPFLVKWFPRFFFSSVGYISVLHNQ